MRGALCFKNQNCRNNNKFKHENEDGFENRSSLKINVNRAIFLRLSWTRVHNKKSL